MTGAEPLSSSGPRYRLIPGTQVARIGSAHFILDDNLDSAPVLFVPTQRVRRKVHDLVKRILEAVPSDTGWPLEQIQELFDSASDRRSVAVLVKTGYLEVVPPDLNRTTRDGVGQPPGRDPGSPPREATPVNISDTRSLAEFEDNNRKHFFRERTFFHVPREIEDAEVDVGLVGVPFASVSAAVGTELGPDYLRMLTQHAGAWHRIHEHGVYSELDLSGGLPRILGKDLVIKDYGDVGAGVRTVGDLMEACGDAVRELVGDHGVRPLFVGGDHAVTFAIVHAFLAHHPDLALIHLDAHNDLFYAESVWYNHAAVVSNLLAYSGLRSVHSFGLRTHMDPRVANVHGISAHPDGLKDRVHLHSISTLRRLLNEPARFREVLQGIGNRPCYLTVDLDVLSPSEVGGRLSTPAGPGLLWEELLEAVHLITGAVDVVGSDIVELNPPRGESSQENPLHPAFLTLLLIQGMAEGRRRG